MDKTTDRPVHAGYPDQKPAIAGYRALTSTEIAQINGLKSLGADLELALKDVAATNGEVIARVNEAYAAMCDEAVQRSNPGNPGAAFAPPPWELLPTDLRTAYAAAQESNRALALAKTNLQQGLMWAVRAVAKPEGF